MRNVIASRSEAIQFCANLRQRPGSHPSMMTANI
jgi:hypothetical protein